VEILKSEGYGVVESVFCLREPLGDGPVRNMAVIAGSHCMMRGLFPPVELLAHYVAVDAHLRVVEEVRRTSGIYQSVRPRPDTYSEQHDCKDGQPASGARVVHA